MDSLPTSIPLGFCQCGCGERTKVSAWMRNGKAYGSGRVARYIRSHDKRTKGVPGPNPSGLCQCGCGGKTRIARDSNHTTGQVRGEPARFILGHQGRGRKLAKRMSDEDRFWSKVRKGDGCWEWLGCKTPTGYGQMGIAGKMHRAHRLAWIFTYGPIPPGMSVCHTCDNPGCARPSDLFLGTPGDNSRDRDAKGRTPKGSRSGNHLLCEATVAEIRRFYDRGLATQKELRRLYNYSAISLIVHRLRWKHVP